MTYREGWMIDEAMAQQGDLPDDVGPDDNGLVDALPELLLVGFTASALTPQWGIWAGRWGCIYAGVVERDGYGRPTEISGLFQRDPDAPGMTPKTAPADGEEFTLEGPTAMQQLLALMETFN